MARTMKEKRFSQQLQSRLTPEFPGDETYPALPGLGDVFVQVNDLLGQDGLLDRPRFLAAFADLMPSAPGALNLLDAFLRCSGASLMTTQSETELLRRRNQVIQQMSRRHWIAEPAATAICDQFILALCGYELPAVQPAPAPAMLSDDFVIRDRVLVRYTGKQPVVHVPDWVEVIGKEAFCGAKQLTGVHLPDSVHTIESRAFCGCKRLTELVLGPNVKSVAFDAFTASSARQCYLNELKRMIRQFDWHKEQISNTFAISGSEQTLPVTKTALGSFLARENLPKNKEYYFYHNNAIVQRSGKKGYVLGEEGIFCHDYFEKPVFIPWYLLSLRERPVDIECVGVNVNLHMNGKKVTLSSALTVTDSMRVELPVLQRRSGQLAQILLHMAWQQPLLRN